MLHTAECRKRLEESLAEEGGARFVQARDRARTGVVSATSQLGVPLGGGEPQAKRSRDQNPAAATAGPGGAASSSSSGAAGSSSTSGAPAATMQVDGDGSQQRKRGPDEDPDDLRHGEAKTGTGDADMGRLDALLMEVRSSQVTKSVQDSINRGQTYPTVDEIVEPDDDEWEWFWDNLSGKELDTSKVKKARAEELQVIRDMGRLGLGASAPERARHQGTVGRRREVRRRTPIAMGGQGVQEWTEVQDHRGVLRVNAAAPDVQGDDDDGRYTSCAERQGRADVSSRGAGHRPDRRHACAFRLESDTSLVRRDSS